MSKGVKLIQEGARDLGYDPGPLDGLWGPKTANALGEVMAADGRPRAADPVGNLPWMAEAMRVMGLHERTHNAALKAFLKSDGATLGDPAQLPWCGDFVATCLRLALPKETFPGRLGENPYWAQNWALFGRETAPTYGCVLVFTRDGGGHVGFCTGADATTFAVLGGNQSNTVSIARIPKTRFLAARWPSTFPTKPINLPGTGGTGLSQSEA